MAKRKSKRKQMTDRLDKLWSHAVKQRVGFKCEYCGKESYLNSHHVFSRSNFSTRWDLSNGFCLCAGCHTLKNFSAHKAPLEFAEWMIEQRGQEWYDDLKRRAHMVIKFSIMDLEEIAGRLQ